MHNVYIMVFIPRVKVLHIYFVNVMCECAFVCVCTWWEQVKYFDVFTLYSSICPYQIRKLEEYKCTKQMQLNNFFSAFIS